MRIIYKLIFIVLCTAGTHFSLHAQKLVAGPVQGDITPCSAKMELMVKNVKQIQLILTAKQTGANKVSQTISTDTLKKVGAVYPIIVKFNNLLPATDYTIEILLDNRKIKKQFLLKTLQSTAINDFSFITGSCALQLPPVINIFTIAGSSKIFSYMQKTPADFMIWLGDYTYYRKRVGVPDDFSSFEAMWKRQMKTRKIKRINYFLTSMPQFAIWDDHDYGSYDAINSFTLKDTSLFIQKQLWANPSYGLPNVKGIFTSFRKYDSDFFLLDDRFYRTEPNIQQGTMLGKEQLDWLFYSLKKSEATFKFIVLGSQFLNPYSLDECYNQFPEEKKKIIDFIEQNKISGVLFISGDSHYSDLQKEQHQNMYPIYDFTCSPISSFLDSPTDAEKANTARVNGTLTKKHCFGKVSVSGTKGNRVCSIELFDKRGKQIWKHEIPEDELKFN